MELRRCDTLGLAAFCLLLFGYATLSGRPLSLHEARLPQCSREMMANHDWLIPRSGGRPWLERPPFPHWVTIGVSALLGQQCDSIWVVRLPSTLMGMIGVLLTAWMAARMYGRGIGLVSGLALATAFEFYFYSCQAEDDIFLAALTTAAMACSVAAEFAKTQLPPRGFLGWRAPSILGFFVLLGATSWAKGPLIGAAVVGVAVAGFLLWDNPRNVRRYVWLWGWLIFALLTAAWPWLMARRYPDVVQNWRFDYAGGTTEYNQPFWYYPVALAAGLLPWTPAVIVGLCIILRRPLSRPARFLLCWAVLPVLLLSLSQRKHHHYLVPSLAPWAILAALGLREIWTRLLSAPRWLSHGALSAAVGLAGAAALWFLRRRIPGPSSATAVLAVTWLTCTIIYHLGVRRRYAPLALASLLGGIAISYCWGQTYAAAATDQTPADTQFLARVEAAVPPDAPLLINGDLHGELDFFRISFYLRPQARLLHNLTFLRDASLPRDQVYLITRAKDEPQLRELGTPQLILQSTYSRREKSPADRFTLFLLHYRPDLKRYIAPLPDAVSVMQAMSRAPGPYCGPDPAQRQGGHP